MTDTADEIRAECAAVCEMLLAKNAAYGDSALNPVRVFSRASTEEQILVRIDDKLSRLSRGSAAGEDVVSDLLGYLVLLRIARRRAPSAAPAPVSDAFRAIAAKLAGDDARRLSVAQAWECYDRGGLGITMGVMRRALGIPLDADDTRPAFEAAWAALQAEAAASATSAE